MAFGLSAGAVSLIGGGLGLLSSGGDKNGGAGASSQQKTPWAPAAPYLENNLKANAEMQAFYQQNPFNAQQKTGMQNTLTDSDNFRSNVMPGLMSFANGAMGSNYQRQTGGAPGSGAGYGGDRRAMQTGPAITPTAQGAFNPAPSGQAFGQIDWQTANPFSAQNKPVPAPAAAAIPDQYKAMFEAWLLQQRMAQEGMYVGAGAGGGEGGGGVSGPGTAGNAGADGDGGPGGVGAW